MRAFTRFCLVFAVFGALCAQESAAPAPTPAFPLIAPTLPENLPELMAARNRTCVVVEFFINHEIDRNRVFTTGLVMDNEGLIIIPEDAVGLYTPPERLSDFKLRFEGDDGEGVPATYVGMNPVSQMHYIRADKVAWPRLAPITDFKTAAPQTGDMLWGLLSQDEEFLYKKFMGNGTLRFWHAYPLRYGFCESNIGAEGAPVFNARGEFVGVGTSGSGTDYVMAIEGKRFRIGLKKLDGTNTFLFAQDFLKYAHLVPTSPAGEPRAWFGVSGVQPIDKEVANFLSLEKRGALVVGEVIKHGPAEAAGLQNKDIIVAVDGKPLEKTYPAANLARRFGLYVLADKNPGDTLDLSVIRGEETHTISVKLGKQPLLDRNARRAYFPRLGLTARELTLDDAVKYFTLFDASAKGAVVHFLRANAPAATAEMKRGDWIKEIDGEAVPDYETAARLLKKAEDDADKKEVVVLVGRGTETKVLRLKLN